MHYDRLITNLFRFLYLFLVEIHLANFNSCRYNNIKIYYFIILFTINDNFFVNFCVNNHLGGFGIIYDSNKSINDKINDNKDYLVITLVLIFLVVIFTYEWVLF